MNWELDTDHRDFQAVCRTFVDRHVRPAVDGAESRSRVPQRLWKELGAAGLLGGGSGYIEESAVARHYRDVRVLRIGVIMARSPRRGRTPACPPGPRTITRCHTQD